MPPDQYADELYGMGGDIGGERYGVAGGDHYSGGVLVYGGANVGYMALVDGADVYAVPAGAVGYGDGSYQAVGDVSSAWLAEFGLDWEYT